MNDWKIVNEKRCGDVMIAEIEPIHGGKRVTVAISVQNGDVHVINPDAPEDKKNVQTHTIVRGKDKIHSIDDLSIGDVLEFPEMELSWLLSSRVKGFSIE